MLTVNWALEQDRDVFSVPGSELSEKSKGTNWLIQQGAKLTTTADDISILRASLYNLPSPCSPILNVRPRMVLRLPKTRLTTSRVRTMY
jgi:predicted Rossmann fold nucleotide-binding protein DprA/Smf involved in DNA uptake